MIVTTSIKQINDHVQFAKQIAKTLFATYVKRDNRSLHTLFATEQPNKFMVVSHWYGVQEVTRS